MADPNTAAVQEEPDELDSWFDEDEDDTYAYAEEASVDDDEEEGESSTPDSDEDVPDEEVPDTSAEATGEGTSTEAKEPEEDPYAWVQELDPDFRKKVESLTNAVKSQAGRAAAEARRNQELQARLDRYNAEQQAKQRTAGTAPIPAAATAKPVEDMDDEELREFMEEYPNVARNVQKLIDARTAQAREEVLEQLRPFQQQQEAARVYEAKQQLRHEAEFIFNTAETGVTLDDVLNSRKWKEWYASQPKGYQQFISNAETIEDSVKVLNDFAGYANAEIQAMMAAQAEQEAEQHTSAADETAARRKDALRGSSPRSRSAEVAQKGTGMSYEDYFNQYADEDA